MPKLYKNGVELHVANDELQAYMARGWEVAPGQTVHMRDEFGDNVNIEAAPGRASITRTARAQGYTPRGDAELEHELRIRELRSKYADGWRDDLRSLAEGVGRGLSFGGSDYLMDALGADMEGIRMRRALNPDASLVGEIGGAVLPAIATLGTGAPAAAGGIGARLAKSGFGTALKATPAGLAMRLGTKVTTGLGGAKSAGLAKAAFARAAGGAVEGTLFGAGTAISDAILHEKPLLSEAVFANIGSNAMYGGAFGMAIGGGMEFLSRAGRGLVSKMKSFKKSDFKHVAGVLDDKGDDFAQVHGSISTELDTVEQFARSTRESLEAEMQALNNIRNETHIIGKRSVQRTRTFTEAESGQHKNLRRMIEELDDSGRRMRAALGSKKVGPLGELVDGAEAGVISQAKLADMMKAGTIPIDTVKAIGGHYDNVKRAMELVNPGTGKDLTQAIAQLGDTAGPAAMGINVIDAAALADLAGIDAGQLPVVGPAADKMLKLWLVFRAADLASGGKLGGKVAKGGRSLMDAPGQFRKGTLINTARDSARRSAVINASRRINTFGLGGTSLTKGAVAGVGGAGVGILFDKIVPRAARQGAMTLPGRIGTAAGASVRKLGNGLDKMMAIGRPIARGAAGWGTMASFKNVKYAELAPENVPKTKDDTDKGYLRVSAEIRYAVGNMARAKRSLKDKLSGLAAIDPLLANELEILRVRQITFLNDRLPKAPAIGMFGTKLNKYGPSEAQVSQFARFVRAVEHPLSVIEDAARWRLTPEAAEAMRDVYPELFAKIQEGVIDHVAKLAKAGKELPYEKRLQLGVLFDAPLDTFLTSENIKFLQSTFMSPEAGMQSPAPQGTLTAAVPTAAQKL